MVPTSFDESNCVLDKPPGMTYDECAPLSVLQTTSPTGYPIVISCWKCTKEDIKNIQETGRVWLTIFGQTMPPVMMDVAKLMPVEETSKE